VVYSYHIARALCLHGPVGFERITAKAVAELQARWIDKLAGVDVFVDSHVRTALIYGRWDD